MLELDRIRKAYTTASFTQVALDDVSVSFRDNEFAAILGPSGSGKTTLLNILGGLDHADSGDIVINGVSTKDYTDKDWDAYRNHRIGFIFQSYNLIPHQTVLANVELALTLAGLPTQERHERARAALARVGLAEHMDKRPNQLSGGQMQRVAIARALVNDPDIVLADEPTGALDTDTGIQVMELLKEIARDRLVVMVTHNPELAEEYATRIIRLRDGRIVDDTDPIDPYLDADEMYAGSHAGAAAVAVAPLRPHAGGVGKHARTKAPQVSDATRHASMSFLTALALSFNNLMTKKGRTFMTAFAGSIGIIGIAAILALSNGVNDYIARTEEEALSSYPLTITKSSFDLASLMMANAGVDDGETTETADETADEPAGLIPQRAIMSDMFANVKNNDLRTFKAFLESGASGIEPYVNSIQYSYGLNPLVYKADTSKGIVRLNPSRMGQTLTNGLSGSALLGGSSMSSFTELLDDRRLLEQSLELTEGRWPEAYDECVLVTSRSGAISDYTLYSLGVYDTKVMDDMTTKILAGEEVEVPETNEDFTVDDALALHFKVVPASSLYRRNDEQGTWTDMTGDKAYMRRVLDQAVDLHVVGIVRHGDGAGASGVAEGIAYTSALTRHLMDVAADAPIVREQLASHDVDVFTGKTFDELAKEEGKDFDFESMFNVDEDALREAFSFDESALEGLGSGLDLSGLDLSSAAGDLDFSDIDFSNMDTSKIAQVFDKKELEKLMTGGPEFKVDEKELASGLDPSKLLEGLDDKKVNAAVDALGKDFASWLTTRAASEQEGEQPPVDVSALMQEYLATESAQAILAPVMQEISAAMGAQVEAVVRQAVEAYMGQLAAYLGEAMASLTPEQLAGGITPELMAELMAGAPQFSLDPSQISLVPQLTEEQQAQLDGAADALAAGFTAWLMQHPEKLVGEDGSEADYTALLEEYLATDSAKKITTPLMAELSRTFGSSVEKSVSSAMNKYMKQYSAYMSEAMAKLMEKAAKQVGAQIAEELGKQISAKMAAVTGKLGGAISEQMTGQMSQLGEALQGGFSVDADAFARAIQFNMTQEDLTSLLTNYMNADELSYEGNLTKLGYATEDSPESISIFPVDFPAKEAVLDIVDDYNERAEHEGREEEAIQYTDLVGALMGSVTDIVNTISLVLIAFVSISLVVSSIMISIITYISVLERKKEIGILRAMGASKLNVANIFNAETVIEGFFAGVLAVAVVYAASIPVNAIVYELKDVPNIMQLPWENAIVLVAISVVLTLIAGLIPSSAAARRDPVEALRSE